MYIIKNVCSVKFFVCTLWPEFSKYRFSANKSLSLRIQQEAERFKARHLGTRNNSRLAAQSHTMPGQQQRAPLLALETESKKVFCKTTFDRMLPTIQSCYFPSK